MVCTPPRVIPRRHRAPRTLGAFYPDFFFVRARGVRARYARAVRGPVLPKNYAPVLPKNYAPRLHRPQHWDAKDPPNIGARKN